MAVSRISSGSALAILDERTTWQNYHQNFNKRVQGVYLLSAGASGGELARYKDCTAVVHKLIAGARSRHALRSLGSGWSFSQVATSDGYLLNNKNLRLYFPFTHPNQVDGLYQGERQNLFCFQAGMTLKAINRVLETKGRALQTSGASDGQTIAGALSTGTHGAALDFGAIPEMVVALHLATGPTTSVWLERASYPVVAPAIAAAFGGELVRDDALFEAALVGLGAFGVLLSVTIEAVPLYLLEVHIRRVPRDASVRNAMDAGDFAGLAVGHPGERPRHFGLVVNPHAPESAFVTLMYERPYRAGYARHDFVDPEASLGDDALSLLSRLIDELPIVGDLALPEIVSNAIDLRYQPVDGKLGTHGEVFAATTTRGKIASTAIALPAERASEALDLVLDLHERAGPYPGAVGLRFVKGSRATLGFTRFPRTCVLEADGVDGNLAGEFNKALWKAFEQSGIEHTVHWGKMCHLTKKRVRSMYGDARVDAWLAARRTLLTPAIRSVFDSAFLRQAGLVEE